MSMVGSFPTISTRPQGLGWMGLSYTGTQDLALWAVDAV
jgi:hypothetical protein